MSRLLALPASSPTASPPPIDPSASATRCSSSLPAGARTKVSPETLALRVGQPAEPERHRPGSHGRQQPAGFNRSQHEHTAGRWLLQQLQQGVGRFLARLLRNEPVGIADDEDPGSAFYRRERGPPLQQPYTRQLVDRHSISRRVERLLPPLLQYLSDRLNRLLHLLVRIRGLGPGDRNQPVDVRVGEAAHQPARPADSAGLIAPLLAQQQLGQPQRHPLLPDPSRSSQK